MMSQPDADHEILGEFGAKSIGTITTGTYSQDYRELLNVQALGKSFSVCLVGQDVCRLPSCGKDSQSLREHI